MKDSGKRTLFKTLTDKLLEIGLSSFILYLLRLPIEYVIGLPIGIEILQIGVYILNERIWAKSTWETSHEMHLCEKNKCKVPTCLCPYHKKMLEEGKNK